MKLKSRIFLITIIFSIICVGIIHLLNSQAVLNDYERFEKEQYSKEINRSISAMVEAQKKLSNLVIDWAEWDATYDYIENRNEAYFDRNIVANTFEKVGFNYFILTNLSEEIVISTGFENTRGILDQIPKELEQFVLDNSQGSYMVLVEDMPMIVNIEEVTDSEAIKKSNGKLAFAYQLDIEAIENINVRNSTSIKIENYKYDSGQKGFWVERREERVTAFFTLAYSNNDDHMLCKIELSGEITALGKAMVEKSLIYTTVTLVLLAILLYFVVKKYVLNEVSHLSEVANEIIRSKKISTRLKLSGSEEFRLLKADMNYMLEVIEKANSKLLYQANNDLLTETINRRGCFDILENQVAKYNGEKIIFTIGYFDIDRLKYVNDRYGHVEGDQLIKAIVKTVKSAIREEDTLCRIGGDEFLIIFRGLDEEASKKIVERVDDRIEEINSLKAFKYELSISKGIVQYDGEMSIDEMIAKADERMYKNKRLNRKV